MRPTALLAAASATAVWAAAALALGFIGLGRWRAPSGGLLGAGWLTFAALTATCVVVAAWLTVRGQPYASLGFSLSVAVWLLPVTAGFAVIPPWAKMIALALPPLLVAALTEVGTGMSRPRPPGRLRWAAWLTSAAASVLLLLAYDPFGDPSCRRTCLSLPVVLEGRMSTGAAMTVTGILVAAATAAGLLAVLRGVGTWPVRLTAVALLVVGVGLTLTQVAPSNTPEARRWLEGVTSIALFLPSAAVVVTSMLVRWRRRGVELLARRLADDTALTGVEFAVGTPPRWVDAHGRGSPLPPNSPATVWSDHHGPLVRWIGARATAPPPAEVLAGLHPATWLALDNARLAASTRAQLVDLRASQQRIVRTSDAERQRIGRDLHDQTQQRLVGASLHLQLAAGRADSLSATALLAAEGRLRPVLVALRDLSHGPFPDVLGDEGLAAALGEWAADQAVDSVTWAVQLGRMPVDVERAGYLAVLALASTAGATVTVERRGASLFVTMIRVDPGSYGGAGAADARTTGPTEEDERATVADRVGAAGGALTETVDAFGRQVVEVVLPCGS